MKRITSKNVLDEIRQSDEYHVERAKMEFALELKRVMDREGVNNTQLAERLGVSKPMISKLLRGDANLTIETMVKVCRSVGGQALIKIVRDGCTARVFELAKTSIARAYEPKSKNAKLALSATHHDDWHLAANDFDLTDTDNESQPVAA